ncbi:non-reducing end alpha-L-arabinofuranosidase family hydrolase [Streptomyces triticirhizae]|uniref:non-reducing end alpha-L-arabinofuranosidase family hydrolase n=1 Tax=Streptomyces triticirhizae TaxID=2483353 RepID=UPI001F1E130A|nr:non-reducing end alpha-L-arabinofuranosidase family hydrolase [Streptomyces triticirhizae]
MRAPAVGAPGDLDRAAPLLRGGAADRRREQGRDGWLDLWTICDATDCHLFFSDGNGHMYRSQTTAAELAEGFDDTAIVLEDADRFWLFEASDVYRLGDSGGCLMIVEALAVASDWRRYFRAWTLTAWTASGPR